VSRILTIWIIFFLCFLFSDGKVFSAGDDKQQIAKVINDFLAANRNQQYNKVKNYIGIRPGFMAESSDIVIKFLKRDKNIIKNAKILVISDVGINSNWIDKEGYLLPCYVDRNGNNCDPTRSDKIKVNTKFATVGLKIAGKPEYLIINGRKKSYFEVDVFLSKGGWKIENCRNHSLEGYNSNYRHPDPLLP